MTVRLTTLALLAAGCAHHAQSSETPVRGKGSRPEPESVNAADVDPEAEEVPDYGLRKGLSRAEVRNLLGRPIRTDVVSWGEQWYYAASGHVSFDSQGKVTGWTEAPEHQGGGFPTANGVKYVAAPEGGTTQVTYRPYFPLIAEDGSSFGAPDFDTGKSKTVYVRGYFRKDRTYVRSHYSSRPPR